MQPNASRPPNTSVARELAPSPQSSALADRLTGNGAILPLFSCLEISGMLLAGNFISGLKYMTRATD